MNLLLDHLWQSTAVLAATGLLTLLFRSNGAHVRHAMWTAASVKFLVPFALLNGWGYALSGLFSSPLPAPVVQAVYGVAQPFSDGLVFEALPAPANPYWLLVLGAGAFVMFAVWLSRWVKLRALVRAARDADIAAPMPVKLSATLMEPGLIGIFRPVLLLPEGIADKLTPAELQAIVMHEACHLRRRDNLTAALHMLVQAIFWFWPPVWWLGTRLIAERERACDEAVLASGSDPQTYAESILKVCKYYVSSPLACASGVSGADLKKRMEEIMRNTVIARLNLPRKALLVASAVGALSLPLALGVLPMPVALAQSGQPRPGTEAALRRQIDAWIRREPLVSELTPSLAEIVKQQREGTQKMIDGWGALKSITFHGEENGWDTYLVEFDKGLSAWSVAPLSEGKIGGMSFAPAVRRAGNTPSSGLVAAIRRFQASHLTGEYPTEIMSPNLQEAITRQKDRASANAKRLGVLRSLAFQQVNARGWDVYLATYENGTSTILAEPLTDGRLNGIFQSDILIPGGRPHSGTEASLRRYVESVQRGQPNYEEMSPQLAQAVRDQLQGIEDGIRPLGALKSITFKGKGTMDVDVYDVVFEKGRALWNVGPLTADGKAHVRNYRVVN